MGNDRGKLRRAHLLNEGQYSQYIKAYLAGRNVFQPGDDQQLIIAQDAFNFQRLKLERVRKKTIFLEITKKDE